MLLLIMMILPTVIVMKIFKFKSCCEVEVEVEEEVGVRVGTGPSRK